MLDRRCMVFIGFDPREAAAFAVARYSAQRRMSVKLPIKGVVLDDLRGRGLYRREMQVRDGRLWDVISDAPCSTEHAISRFLIKELAQEGWAMFVDGDVLVRGNLTRIFDELDPRYALYCVKHAPSTDEGTKMDNQLQWTYERKWWSSCFILNVDHAANRALTVDLVNELPGRNLHRFCWLADNQIGELGLEYNYLVGVSPQPLVSPKIAHFTLGCPDMDGYRDCEFAEEWRAELTSWAAGH